MAYPWKDSDTNRGKQPCPTHPPPKSTPDRIATPIHDRYLGGHIDHRSARAIAQMLLGRNVSTVGRELRRGLDPEDAESRYCPTRMAQSYRHRRLHSLSRRQQREHQWPAAPQYMPRGTDLSEHSQTYLNDMARLLKRPRKTLGLVTPEENMAEDFQALGKTVALDS